MASRPEFESTHRSRYDLFAGVGVLLRLPPNPPWTFGFDGAEAGTDVAGDVTLDVADTGTEIGVEGVAVGAATGELKSGVMDLMVLQTTSTEAWLPYCIARADAAGVRVNGIAGGACAQIFSASGKAGTSHRRRSRKFCTQSRCCVQPSHLIHSRRGEAALIRRALTPETVSSNNRLPHQVRSQVEQAVLLQLVLQRASTDAQSACGRFPIRGELGEGLSQQQLLGVSDRHSDLDGE